MQPIQADIKSRAWLEDKTTQHLMQILNDQGTRINALFVGGCVRNVLIGKDVEDIDIACVFAPHKTAELLSSQGFKIIPTGIDHGTITAIKDKKSYEITTLRKDVQTDGRHAVVEFSEDWQEDARRRDFTMNTLLADQEGHIYDPLNIGYKHLQQRKIIFVGEPEKRIEEDHLRIMRFFRFHALYGVGEADGAALKACQIAADKLMNISKERITAEFTKIISSGNAADILNLMWTHNVLTTLRFDSFKTQNLKHLITFQENYGLEFISSRLYMICGLDRENLSRLNEVLLLPKVLIKDMIAIDHILSLPALKTEQAVKESIYRYGRVPTAQALMIELVQDRVMNGYAPQAISIIQKWDVPNFPLSGQDLIEQGMSPGPALGKELARREEKWIASGFSSEVV
tara:strand:+ start:21038 stop:22240 length:1203 start_codon:yes stop_codon:yes gene_type:complete